MSKLLGELKVTKVKISSGFRTQADNKAIGGSKKSAHCTGEAVDLYDTMGSLAVSINADPSILDRYDLYMENTYYTKNWVHLSTRPTLSGRRVFTP